MKTLKIQTALDVADYMESLKSGRSRPLKNVTYEYHYHTIEADTEEILDRVEQALDKKGYLVRENWNNKNLKTGADWLRFLCEKLSFEIGIGV